jgi:hypothetical protein
MRCLQNRHDERRADRSNSWNLAKQPPSLVLLAFQQQIPPHLLAQGAQGIQLLVVMFGTSPDAGFADLAEPF